MKLQTLAQQPFFTFYTSDTSSKLFLPYVNNGISAGFPSRADDFLDLNIDLNKHLIKNPSTTFYSKVRGNSMMDAGIHNGDLLIIDKSLEPKNNKIAVCFIDGEFIVKSIQIEMDIVLLVAENKDYKPLKVTKHKDPIIWASSSVP